MDTKILPGPNFKPWGPFIKKDQFVIQLTSHADLIVAGTIFATSNIFAISAALIAFRQTMQSPRPMRSHYIWMIWLEWASSVALNIECLLHLLYIVRPSFYFYMSICKVTAVVC